MRNLIVLAPLALLAACGGGATAHNTAAATKAATYTYPECVGDMQRTYSPGDAVMLCNCVAERNREGQVKDQAIASCRQRLRLDWGDQPIDNSMIQ